MSIKPQYLLGFINSFRSSRDQKSIKFEPQIYRFFHQKKSSQKILKKIVLEGSRPSFWRGLGGSWAPLGCSWAPFGRLFAPPCTLLGIAVTSLGPLGCILGPPGSILGSIWRGLGRVGRIWEGFVSIWPPFWSSLGPIWAALGSFVGNRFFFRFSKGTPALPRYASRSVTMRGGPPSAC